MANTLPSVFSRDPFFRNFIGSDNLFTVMDRFLDAAPSLGNKYPPYNILKNKDNYTLEIAVAGFEKDEITVEALDNKLNINGAQKSHDSVEYIHKGIAERDFQLTFVLSDSIEVKDAKLENGLLRVYLENKVPEHKKPKVISIR